MSPLVHKQDKFTKGEMSLIKSSDLEEAGRLRGTRGGAAQKRRYLLERADALKPFLSFFVSLTARQEEQLVVMPLLVP